jgi:hypothetical protein
MRSTIVAGETFNYSAAPADYLATGGWSLRLVLNPRAGGVNVTVNSTASVDEHLLQATAATTADWAAGLYGWELWALKDAEQYRLQAGQLRVLPSLLAAAAGTDTRSDAQIALDAVTATINGTATGGVLSYSIDGRELRRYSMEELIVLQNKLANDVRNEQDQAARDAGRPTSRKISVRMGRA